MKKLWLAVGLIAVLSVLVVIAWVPIAGSPREPEYHGRKLTAWLDDLSASSALTRTNATAAIQQMGTNAVPFLVQMLHAQDSPFRRRYITLLGQQHWVNLHLHYDSVMRVQALRALAILGPDAKAAVPDVADLLKDTGDGTMAAYTLYRIGSNGIPALQSALTNSNVWTRRHAAMMLGAAGQSSSVSNLLAALKDPDPFTRDGAVMTLRRFPEQANVIVPALANCLDDPDDVFVSNIARTLGTFGTNARLAFPKLLKLVGSSKHHVGEAATLALMRIDSDGTLAAFTNYLESPDVNVRRTTARALTNFQSEGEPAVPFLVKCLKDPDAEVRQNAAVALRDIAEDPDVVVPALIENLSDTNGQVRVVSAIALGSFGDRAKPAVPQILKIIEENTNDELMAEGLYNALSDIDPAAAAKLNGK
jgi:HEAT repeat protein